MSIKPFARGVFRWMDSSLFFRGLSAIMDFLKRVAMGSFIVGLFAGEENRRGQAALKHSLFARAARKALNGPPKPFAPPKSWPGALSRLAAGSRLVNTLSNYLDTPIPKEKGLGGGLFQHSPPKKNFFSDFRSIITWLLFALPVWGMAAVTLAAPVLPTMVMAALLLPVLFFMLLSRPFDVDYMAVFLLLFALVNFAAGFMSFTPRESIRIALLVSLFMAAALAVPACCRSKGSVDIFFLAFLGGAGLTGLVGLYQVAGGYAAQIWQDLDMFADIRLRVFSTLGNPNAYGTYLLLAIPLAAASIVYFRRPVLKILTAGLTGLLLVNLLLTYSRGCYLALALAAGVFVLLIEKRLVVLFLPALAALPFLLPATVVNRALSIVNAADTATAFRLSIWQGSARVLQDFWMVGIGQGAGAYNRVFPYYAFAATVAEHSHNLFLQTALELGVLGLAAFLGVLACFFRAMANFLRRAAEFRLRVIAAAFMAAVIGFLFQGVFDHALYNFRVLLTFYIFLGLGIAFAKANAAPPARAARTTDEPPLVSGYY